MSTSSRGENISGWIKSQDTSPWDKALTLVFADRMGRDPALFFKSSSDLNRLVSSENIRLGIDRLVQGVGRPNSPILATEPRDESVPHKKFYLMPVFNYSDEYEQYNLRLLNVGIIDPGTQKAAPTHSRQPGYSGRQSGPETFSAGLAFIVDTTISMGPYIEQTKKFIHSAYDALERSPIAPNVSFAVVGYRNSTRFNPRLEYVSTVIAPFAPVAKRHEAEMQVGSMDEAKVSTHAFNEDAFAAIKTAIDDLDWSPFAVKMAVMITDAGAIRSTDPYSSTGMNENEMADLLAQKGIRLVVIHLQTRSGKKHNLSGVIQQYKRLTSVRDGTVKSTYVPLPVRNVDEATQQFSRIASALMQVLQKIVQNASHGAVVAKPKETMTAPEVSPESSARYMAECLGYSAYLEFAGQKKNVAAPSLVEAWVADKDLDSLSQGRSTDSLIPCVLLNKMQLDTLSRQIGILVDAARASRTTDSRGFFQRIISLSSQTVRDPERMQHSSGANLCQEGLLPEFLQGLPYKSQVMNLTEQRWISMNAMEQDELIASLSAKMRLYTEYHNDVDNWVRFEGAPPSEALYRVPLTSLP
ncbi:MAG: VWA domain-containing protein [Desulfovibrionaceae bacterium]|nr:VWA domain-containing protein [Desulfovibrionaceae bacterium]